jgi:hypothetical protein
MWREGEDKPRARGDAWFFHRCEADLQHLLANDGAFPAQMTGAREKRANEFLELRFCSIEPNSSRSKMRA